MKGAVDCPNFLIMAAVQASCRQEQKSLDYGITRADLISISLGIRCISFVQFYLGPLLRCPVRYLQDRNGVGGESEGWVAG